MTTYCTLRAPCVLRCSGTLLLPALPAHLVDVEVACHSNKCDGLVLTQVKCRHQPVTSILVHACQSAHTGAIQEANSQCDNAVNDWLLEQ